jgi:hypothetical protein
MVGARHDHDRRGDGRATGGHYARQPGSRSEDVAFYGEYLEIDPRDARWTFMFDVEGVGPMGVPDKSRTWAAGRRSRRSRSYLRRGIGRLESGMIEGGLELWIASPSCGRGLIPADRGDATTRPLDASWRLFPVEGLWWRVSAQLPT